MISQEQLAYVAKKVGYVTQKRYTVRSEFILDGLNLEGARVLEIGCGRGTFCIWAASHGAQYVLGIEPEAEGSTAGTLQSFREVVETLHLTNIEARGIFLHELEVPQMPFDIIIMFNVINHLDENNVQILHRNKEAEDKYVSLICGLKKYIKSDGIVIVADCTRRNFWNDVGLKSPLSPTIEWYKHQNPRQWIKVFNRAGFSLYDFRWSVMRPFGKLASNFVFQYFTGSHFVLRFQNQ